jgi:hypothetical protein
MAKKHVDPDPDSDPEHWLRLESLISTFLADLIDVFCSGPGEAASVVTADHVQRRGVRLASCAHTQNTV